MLGGKIRTGTELGNVLTDDLACDVVERSRCQPADEMLDAEPIGAHCVAGPAQHDQPFDECPNIVHQPTPRFGSSFTPP